jgi:hypothetical protein
LSISKHLSILEIVSFWRCFARWETRNTPCSLRVIWVQSYNQICWVWFRKECGFLGSFHDTLYFTNSKLWLKFEEFFEGDEYLLANKLNLPLFRIPIPTYKQTCSISTKQFSIQYPPWVDTSKVESLKGVWTQIMKI